MIQTFEHSYGLIWVRQVGPKPNGIYVKLPMRYVNENPASGVMPHIYCMKFSCAIIDDDPVTCQLLIAHCAQSGRFQEPIVANTAFEGLKAINSERVDVLFLDFNLPDATGKEILESLNDDIQVIMVTSEPGFAIDSFKFNVRGYLLKPFSFSDFTEMTRNLTRDHKDHLFVKSGNERVRLLFDDILFIKSDSNYVSFQKDRSRTMSLMRLADLVEGVLPERFIQCHRSYIVNTSKIDRVQRGSIWIGEHEVPVSEQYRESLNDVLGLDS